MAILRIRKKRNFTKTIGIVLSVVALCFFMNGVTPVNKGISPDIHDVIQQLRTEKDLIQPMEGDILEEEGHSSSKRELFSQKFTAKSNVTDSLEYYKSQFIAHGWTEKKTVDDKYETEIHYHKFYKGKEMLAVFSFRNYVTYSVRFEYDPRHQQTN